ncbi:MAG TPA: hypothetical protein VN256_15135 [Pyrinomonadaceae bacterium]|nr:hypothetical protein [Pyrinomonadaceae bacterium]
MSSFIYDVTRLIENMVEIFQRKKVSKAISERITRGRASASSSEFEEEVAALIATYTPRDINILVDYPISYWRPEFTKTKTFYPDIALIRANSLIAIVEAKIDLGYLPADWTKKRKATLRQLHSAAKVTRNREPLTVSERLITAGVVLSTRNHPERWPMFVEEVDNAVFLISKEHRHPNDPLDESARPTYIANVRTDKIHLEQWEKLERLIKALG